MGHTTQDNFDHDFRKWSIGYHGTTEILIGMSAKMELTEFL
jgi:hypothetical protein